MQKKYQIFISSTYEDLKEHREAVIKSCLQMGHVPVGMEMFNPADEEQWTLITRTIDTCDYYCLIVAQRYGSVLEGVSYTEREYDYAVEAGVPALRFILDSNADWKPALAEKDEAGRQALDRFKVKLKKKMVAFWRTKEELQYKLTAALPQAIIIHPRPGWIRVADQGYEEALEGIARLSKENAALRDEIQVLRSIKHTSEEDEDTIKEMIATKISVKLVYSTPQKQEWKEEVEECLANLFLCIMQPLVHANESSHLESSLVLRLRGPDAPLKVTNIEEVVTRLTLLGLVDVNIGYATTMGGGGSRMRRTYMLTEKGRRIARKLAETHERNKQ